MNCLKCNICCRFPEKHSPLIPFFLGKERGAYYGCRVDVIKHGDGYICPYFLPESPGARGKGGGRCSIYEKRPLDCRLYPYMVTYDDSYKKVILVLDNNCPSQFPVPDVEEIKITEQDIGFINDPQPNTTFVKELHELTRSVFGETGRFRKLRLEDGHIIPYLWKDIMNVLYDEETGTIKHFTQNKDYIYLRRDLVELKGDKFKDKRNLCNYFQKNYTYRIERLVPSDEHLSLYKKWVGDKKAKPHFATPYYWQLAEDSYFFHRRAFIDFNKLGLEGIEIRVDNSLAGYTYGFKKGDTFYILGEITDQSYKGINQFIFREFCRNISERYINTMDDSEIEGLRRNKSSYRPIQTPQ